MEIFYCFRCGARIRSIDLDAGAVRFANRIACAECAELSGLIARDDSPHGSPPESSSDLPEAPEPSPSPRKRTLVWAGVGGLAVLTLTAVLLVLLRPSAPTAPRDFPLEDVRAGAPLPSPLMDPARKELEDAKSYAKEAPGDLAGRIERFRRIAWKYDGTPVGDEGLRELESLRAERDSRLDARLAELDARLDPLMNASKWKEARELVETVRTEADPPRLNQALKLRIREIEDAARKPLEKLHIPTAPLPSVSKEAVAAWSKACERAFIRDYAGAEALLKEALASAENEPTRRELREDLERFAAVARFFQGAWAGLRSTSPGTRLTLQVWDDDGKLARLEGRMVEAHEKWMVLRRAGCRFHEAVSFDDIAAASWIEGASGDPVTAALFCLLEGDVDSARTRLVDRSRVPEKYWTRRPPPGPPRDVLPVAATNERQARRRLAAADARFGFLPSRAEAVLAYRKLLEDYGETTTVDADRSRIRERMNACREMLIPARHLFPSGNFKRSSWTSRNIEVPDCWTASEDIDWRESLENYVEIDFPALPKTPYRCWVYVGGCCLESFTFHFQASEYTAKDPDSGNVLAAEPGGNFAFPLKPKGFFRSRHAQHARAGKPKQPERWQWIEVPLPEFADAGAKTIRLLTHQQGFSVACAIVSADRETAPKDEEAVEILKQPEPDIPGTPEPAQWLLFGPLPNRGFGSVDDPQRRVDLSDPEGWIPAFAQIRAAGTGRAAVFDFAARYTPNENVVAFALTHVRSPEDRDATLLLGSDDGVEAWLDGTLIHRLNRGRGVKLDEDRVEIRLRSGWNRLLIKVYQGKGGWGLGARIADRSGQPMKDLAYDPWGDLPDVLR